MTNDAVEQTCSKACGFASFMLGLCAKLHAEGNRPPTEREATEIAEQLEALRQAAQSPKSIELD